MTPETDDLAISLLEEASASLDISKSQRDEISASYDAVGKAICEAELMEDCPPLIQAQGSILLDTVVKPAPNEEFDVDATCLLKLNHLITPSRSVYEKVFHALKGHGTYTSMCERKNRCIRINYSGNYHLDMTPCVPNGNAPKAIYVPDSEHQCWKPSNPQRYAQFFDDVAKVQPLFTEEFMVIANSRELSKRGTVEPIPETSGFKKAFLKRIVQCLKRHRDLYFKDRGDTVISIIITTLAARAYGRLAAPPNVHSNRLDFLVKVVEDMKNHIRTVETFNHLKYYVDNPAVDGENFAEKWNVNPQLPKAFWEWHGSVLHKLKELRDASKLSLGSHSLSRRIGEIHGPSVSQIAANNIADRTARQHRAGLVTITSGLGIGQGAVAAPPTKYYGND